MNDRPAPLAGRRVVICRRPGESDALVDRLTELGADVVLLPLQQPAPPADGGRSLAMAWQRIDHYRWLAVTSANAVGPVSSALAGASAEPSTVAVPAALRVAAVGPATAAALAARGFQAHVVPERATAADLARAMIDDDRRAARPPGRVLAPLADAAGPDLQHGLSAAGYEVDRVDAYRMVPLTPSPADLGRAGRADVVVVTAPSIVRRLVELDVGPGEGAGPNRIVAIGPRSADAVTAAGLGPVVEAADTDVDALVDAVSAALADRADR